jgi:hypothetical protein
VGRLAPGYRADLIGLDAEHPLLYGRTGDLRPDSLVFCGNANPDPGRHDWRSLARQGTAAIPTGSESPQPIVGPLTNSPDGSPTF